jgi:hypothetical protein
MMAAPRADAHTPARGTGSGWPGSTPLLLPVVGALDTFRGLVNDLAPDVRGMFTDVAPAIEPLAEGVAGLVRNAAPGVRDLVRESAPLLAEVGAVLPPLGSGLSRLLTGASRGAPGAAALVKDLIGALSHQAAFWGTVIQCASRAYLAARQAVTGAGQALSGAGRAASGIGQAVADVRMAAADRIGRRFGYLFDEATTAIGVGIGAVLKPFFGEHDDRRPTASTVDPGPSLFHEVRGLLTDLAGAASEAVAGLANPILGAGARLWYAGIEAGARLRDAGVGVLQSLDPGAQEALIIMRRAIGNVVAGALGALRIPPAGPAAGWARLAARPVGAEVPKLDRGLAGLLPQLTAPTGEVGTAAGPPPGVTVNGLNVNFYGLGDFTDPAVLERVAAGVSDVLSRAR